MAVRDIEEALALSPLLSGLAVPALGMTEVAYAKGEPVRDVWEERPAVGLVISGTVAVSSDAPDGRDVRLSTLKKGDCFGIANLFSPDPLQTILRCEKDCEIAFIPKERLINLLGEDGDFAVRYARLSNEKLQFLIRRIELLTTQNHQTRLIAWLMSGENSIPDEKGEKDEIRFPGKRESLAAHLGMSRAALFRELAQLDREGLIATRGTVVRILDREGLALRLKGAESAVPEEDAAALV